VVQFRPSKRGEEVVGLMGGNRLIVLGYHLIFLQRLGWGKERQEKTYCFFRQPNLMENYIRKRMERKGIIKKTGLVSGGGSSQIPKWARRSGGRKKEQEY